MQIWLTNIQSRMDDIVPETECPFVLPLPLIGGSADRAGTAGVMLTIIIKYFCDDKYFRLTAQLFFYHCPLLT